MRTEQLTYLLETAQHSSISKASEKLHITQQSLNTALKKLEDEMGVALFERNYAGIKLTEQGKIATRYAEEILQKLDEMKEAVTDCVECIDGDALSGHFTLYVSASAMHALVPSALQFLMRRHPRVKVTLFEKENRDMVRSIMQGEDVACITTVIEGLDRDFEMLDRKKVFYQKLAEAKMYVSAAEGHPLAKQKSVTAHTLLKYPLGIYESNPEVPQAVVGWLKGKAGKQGPNIRLETNNIRIYQKAVDSGEVIGFVPKVTCKESIDVREGVNYLLVRDFPPFETVITMDWQYYNSHQELVQAFMECVEEVLAN